MAWELLCLTVFLTIFYYLKTCLNRYKLPPGPRGLPLLGNVFQFDAFRPWLMFFKWKDVYGPMFYLNLTGQPVIVLNSKKVTEDLLDRRALKYSDRPPFTVTNMITGYLNIVTLSYGETWRKLRRASETALGIKVSSKYHRVQLDQSVILAYDILNDTTIWKSQVDRAVSSIILSLVYDLPPIESFDDPSLVFVNEVLDHTVQSLLPGAYLVDTFPILKHLPRFLAKWKRDAEADFERYNHKLEEMFLATKRGIASGQEQRPSFCAILAEKEKRHTMSDQGCAWLAGMLYAAGYETTASTIRWFIFAMVMFPSVQQRAQEALDKVVGRSRLPSFADMKHLPYIRALVKELLRWRPPVPIGISHASNEDDYYDGYFIPKGSLVIANQWSINRDPEIYGPDAEDFRPERHLDSVGNLKDDTTEGHFTYGFGHRICVGRHVANNSLFISMAMILWTTRLELEA